MAVEFELTGQKFVALNGWPRFTFNEAISFQIFCADQDEVDYYWSRLSEGGQEVACGWLKDRYGLSWQVVPAVLMDMMSDPDPQKAKRATEAMLAMTKFDIAARRPRRRHGQPQRSIPRRRGARPARPGRPAARPAPRRPAPPPLAG